MRVRVGDGVAHPRRHCGGTKSFSKFESSKG